MRKFKPHPIYGDNPTVPRCFWCGKARNELVKLGNRITHEAPMYMVVDYKPCEACEKLREGKLVMVEVTTVDNPHFPPIVTSANGIKFFPTRKWSTAPMEQVLTLFEPPLRASLRRDKIAFMDANTYAGMLETTRGDRTSNQVPGSPGLAPSGADQ